MGRWGDGEMGRRGNQLIGVFLHYVGKICPKNIIPYFERLLCFKILF